MQIDSLNMPPRLSINNLAGCRNGYAVLLGDMPQGCYASHVIASYFPDLAVGKFCIVTRNALRLAVSRSHVARVICRSARLQMLRVHTKAVVAFVANNDTWGINLAICQPVSYATSVSTDAAPPNMPIPSVRSASPPQPASVCFVYQRPKVFGRLNEREQAQTGAVLSRSPRPIKGIRFYLERSVAVLASAIYENYSLLNHDLNLCDRLGLWLARSVFPHLAGRLHFSTEGGFLCRV